MKYIIFCFLLFPLALFGEEFILVKQIWGKVNLIENNVKSEIKSFHRIQKNQLIQLDNETSKIWIRDQDNNHVILQFSDNKYMFSHSDIIDKINELNKSVSNYETSVKKFFSLISNPNSNLGTEVNGMIISPPTGVTRSRNNFIKLDDIYVFENFPAEISSLHLFENIEAGSIYNFKLYDRLGREVKLEQTSDLSSITLQFDSIKGPIETVFKLEITSKESQQKIFAFIKLDNISKKEKQIFYELRDLAISELYSNESFYQIIFIEALLSRNLIVNANYFLNFFISRTDNYEINELYKKYNSF